MSAELLTPVILADSCSNEDRQSTQAAYTSMLNQSLQRYVNWARALYRMWQVVSPEHQRHFRPIQTSLLGSLLKETWAQMSPNHDVELVWCICVFADLKATTRAACVQDAEEAKLLLKLKEIGRAHV